MQLSASDTFDRLRVGTEEMESSNLDGTLSVSVIGDFVPSGDDSFLIVDGPTEGSFSNCPPSEQTCTGLPALDPGLTWEVIHGSVKLSVVAVSPLYFAQFGDGETASASDVQILGGERAHVKRCVNRLRRLSPSTPG